MFILKYNCFVYLFVVTVKVTTLFYIWNTVDDIHVDGVIKPVYENVTE